jgi:hypothetical protein
VVDTPSAPSQWSFDGWRIWIALAVACVLSVWVPVLISLRFPVYALDYWGVLSGYIGVSWAAPAALTGLAVSNYARQRGLRRRRLLAGAVGALTGVVLIVSLASWIVGIEDRLTGETTGSPTARDETTATAPADLVRQEAEASPPVQEVVCAPISDASFFCAVTFRGPSCQLWMVQNGVATALPTIMRGASGSRSGTGVRCGR